MLITPEPGGHFAVGYAVLALSFVLEGISFLQSVRQARPEAASLHRDLIEHVLATSVRPCERCSLKTPPPWLACSSRRPAWPPTS